MFVGKKSALLISGAFLFSTFSWVSQNVYADGGKNKEYYGQKIVEEVSKTSTGDNNEKKEGLIRRLLSMDEGRELIAAILGIAVVYCYAHGVGLPMLTEQAEYDYDRKDEEDELLRSRLMLGQVIKCSFVNGNKSPIARGSDLHVFIDTVNKTPALKKLCGERLFIPEERAKIITGDKDCSACMVKLSDNLKFDDIASEGLQLIVYPSNGKMIVLTFNGEIKGDVLAAFINETFLYQSKYRFDLIDGHYTIQERETTCEARLHYGRVKDFAEECLVRKSDLASISNYKDFIPSKGSDLYKFANYIAQHNRNIIGGGTFSSNNVVSRRVCRELFPVSEGRVNRRGRILLEARLDPSSGEALSPVFFGLARLDTNSERNMSCDSDYIRVFKRDVTAGRICRFLNETAFYNSESRLEFDGQTYKTETKEVNGTNMLALKAMSEMENEKRDDYCKEKEAALFYKKSDEYVNGRVNNIYDIYHSEEMLYNMNNMINLNNSTQQK